MPPRYVCSFVWLSFSYHTLNQGIVSGRYSLEGVLKGTGGCIVKVSITIIYFAHLTTLDVYGVFFEDDFYLVFIIFTSRHFLTI